MPPRQHSPAVMLNLLGDLWFDASRPSGRRCATSAGLGGGAGLARQRICICTASCAPAGAQDGPPDDYRRNARSRRVPRRSRLPPCWASPWREAGTGVMLDGHSAEAIGTGRCGAARRCTGRVSDRDGVWAGRRRRQTTLPWPRCSAAKGRPSDHPLIVHVDDTAKGADGVAHFADEVPDYAQALMQAFWPGPLTLILPRRAGVGAAAAGGQDSIGLRCPDHPVAQALLHACRALGVMGLAAPSANQFGRVSPTTAAHVQGEFGARLADSRWRRLRCRHRVDDRRLHPRGAGAVAPGRDSCRAARKGRGPTGVVRSTACRSGAGTTCVRHPARALRATRQVAPDGWPGAADAHWMCWAWTSRLRRSRGR